MKYLEVPSLSLVQLDSTISQCFVEQLCSPCLHWFVCGNQKGCKTAQKKKKKPVPFYLVPVFWQ